MQVRALLLDDRFAEAQTVLDQARAQWPGNPGLAEEQVGLWLRTGRGAQALRLARGVLASSPGRPQAIARLAEALVDQGESGEALQVVALQPTSDWSPALFELAIDCRLRLEQASGALEDSREWIAAQSAPGRLHQFIVRLLQRNAKPFALALARIATARWPQDAGLLQAAFQTAGANLKWRLALRWLDDLIALQPDNPMHHALKASITFRHLGHMESAARAAADALRIDANRVDMRLLAGNAHFLAGDLAQATTMALSAFDHPAATLEQRWASASVLHASDIDADTRARIDGVLAEGMAPGQQAPFVLLTHGVQVLIPARATTVVVVFSGLDHGWALNFSELSALLAPMDVGLMFLQDFQRDFYLCGIASLAPDYAGTVEALRRLLPRPGLRLFCLGVSGGGFAALHYGAALGAERSLLFAAQTNGAPGAMQLDARAKIAYRRILQKAPERVVDTRPLLEANPAGPRIDLWYGEQMPRDRQHALHLQGVPNVHLHPIDGLSAHDVVTHLKAVGRFEPLLKQWLADAGVTVATAPASAGDADTALA